MQSTDFDKNGRMDYRTDSYGSVLLILCGSGLHMVYPWLGDIRNFGLDSVLHELWLGATYGVVHMARTCIFVCCKPTCTSMLACVCVCDL